MITQTFDKILVSDWREAYKFLSLWFFLLIGLSPELFDLAVQYKLLDAESLPAVFGRMVNWVAFLGAASRIVNQAAVLKGLMPAKAEAEA